MLLHTLMVKHSMAKEANERLLKQILTFFNKRCINSRLGITDLRPEAPTTQRESERKRGFTFFVRYLSSTSTDSESTHQGKNISFTK